MAFLESLILSILSSRFSKVYNERTMIGLLCLAVAQQSPPVPARASRAAFTHAIRIVKRGWSRTQVRRLLGRPDDVWPQNDSINYVMYGDETWCYGTNGHHTFPTLGRVTFRDGKVLTVAGGWGEPPPVKVIGESELTEAMRKMYRRPNRNMMWLDSDSQRLIQVANLLIPKGQAKALAILGEYGRTNLGDRDSDWLFWLVRVLFTSKRPGGVFPIPSIGVISPLPPKDLRKWPTYPVAIVDDVPVVFVRGVELAGKTKPFALYMREHMKEWTLRKTTLTPPDDPFPTYRKLKAAHAETPLKAFLGLVRSAYRPRNLEESARVQGTDYDRHHKAFLALGCRWDVQRQMYVRRNGSVLPDQADEVLQTQYRFQGVPRLDIAVTYSRRTPKSVDVQTICEETRRGKVGPAILVAEDPESGAELHYMAINDPDVPPPWETTREKIMARAPHPSQPGGIGTGFGFDLNAGRRVRFVILFGGKRYVSPKFVP